MPRLGLGLGLAKGSVLPTIDAEALALYNRVIADGGIVPAGLSGMDAYIKAAKAARGISTLAQGYLSLAHPHYTGIRLATGTGPTAGNRAARTVYNAIGATGDFIQTTAANQPLALVHSGANYAWLPGVAGNSFTTPNATANQITGNIDIIAHIIYANNGAPQTVVSRTMTAPNSTFELGISATNRLFMQYNIGGYALAQSSTGIAANYTGWVRLTRNSATGEFLFYTSSDSVSTPISSINWVQLGTSVAGTAGNATLYTGPVQIGSSFTSEAQRFQGVINRVCVSNSIGGTPVIDFNPDSYNRATSQTSWTSSTGEVWTLNTPATNNALKAAIVDTTMIMGNGTSYGLQAASLNMDQAAITSYTAFKKYVNTAGGQIINELGTNPSSGTGPGKYLAINGSLNQEEFGIQANAGLTNSLFTSISLNLKLAIAINNIANTNESFPYLINNSNQTFISNGSIFNNTANMNATGYNLLARNNAASLWANAIWVAGIENIGEDGTTQQTSMYNFLKTYINGI